MIEKALPATKLKWSDRVRGVRHPTRRCSITHISQDEPVIAEFAMAGNLQIELLTQPV
jgi:hypothetical protein